MTRHVRRALSLTLASALFSAGAWGQGTDIRQTVTGVVKVASEYFGTAEGRELGRSVSGTTGGPTVVLTPGAAVSAGSVADITFDLSGATFAGTVSASALRDSTTASAISTEVRSGGAEGDASVTFRVEVETDTSGPFNFLVPTLMATGTVLETNPLTGAPTRVGVAVTSSIASVRASGTSFPDVIQGGGGNRTATPPTGTNDNDADTVDEISPMLSQVYDTMSPALNFTWSSARATPSRLTCGTARPSSRCSPRPLIRGTTPTRRSVRCGSGTLNVSANGVTPASTSRTCAAGMTR